MIRIENLYSKKLFNIVCFIALSAVITSCGGAEFIQGDEELSYLKGAEKIGIKFDYSDMAVENFESEEAYINYHVKKRNEDEPGKGDEWKRKWEENKRRIYEGTFLGQLNTYLIEMDMEADKDTENTEYQLIVKVKYLDPGWYAGIVENSAEMTSRYEIVDSKGKSKTVLKTEGILSETSQTTVSGADLFSVKQRLKNVYQTSAIHLGRYFQEYLSEG